MGWPKDYLRVNTDLQISVLATDIVLGWVRTKIYQNTLTMFLGKNAPWLVLGSLSPNSVLFFLLLAGFRHVPKRCYQLSIPKELCQGKNKRYMICLCLYICAHTCIYIYIYVCVCACVCIHICSSCVCLMNKPIQTSCASCIFSRLYLTKFSFYDGVVVEPSSPRGRTSHIALMKLG